MKIHTFPLVEGKSPVIDLEDLAKEDLHTSEILTIQTQTTWENPSPNQIISRISEMIHGIRDYSPVVSLPIVVPRYAFRFPKDFTRKKRQQFLMGVGRLFGVNMRGAKDIVLRGIYPEKRI